MNKQDAEYLVDGEENRPATLDDVKKVISLLKESSFFR